MEDIQHIRIVGQKLGGTAQASPCDEVVQQEVQVLIPGIPGRRGRSGPLSGPELVQVPHLGFVETNGHPDTPWLSVESNLTNLTNLIPFGICGICGICGM